MCGATGGPAAGMWCEDGYGGGVAIGAEATSACGTDVRPVGRVEDRARRGRGRPAPGARARFASEPTGPQAAALAERSPELGHARVARARVDRERAPEHLLDLVGHVRAAGARGRAPAGSCDALHDRHDVAPVDRLAIREELGREQRKGVDVGGEPRRPEARVDLLGRRVEQRERAERALRGARVAFLHELRDAEIEDLHALALLALREEDVRRLDVPVRDLPRVSHREPRRDRLEDREGLLEGAPPHAALTALDDVLREREALEPLEHHVRRPEAARRGHQSVVDGAHDVQGLLRERVEEPRLLAELREERLLHAPVLDREDLEDLDRDRLLEAAVPRPVDHPEAALAHDGRDVELTVERHADEPERIVGCRARRGHREEG